MINNYQHSGAEDLFMDIDNYSLHWLWSEIGRRFGPDQATELMVEFELHRRAAAKNALLEQYRNELPQIEEKLRRLEAAGEPETAYTLSLRQRAEHYRQLLQEARGAKQSA